MTVDLPVKFRGVELMTPTYHGGGHLTVDRGVIVARSAGLNRLRSQFDELTHRHSAVEAYHDNGNMTVALVGDADDRIHVTVRRARWRRVGAAIGAAGFEVYVAQPRGRRYSPGLLHQIGRHVKLAYPRRIRGEGGADPGG